MLRFQTIGGLALLLASLGAKCCPAVAQEAEAVYQVGVAKRDVTPDYSVRLNGFAARKSPSTGVSQPIWARAMAIQNANQEPVVVVTLDSLGIRTAMVDEVVKRINVSRSLQRERLIVTFTHTHSAPKVNGASDNIFAQAIPEDDQEHIDRYTEELTDALAAVVEAALSDMQPATLEWGVGRVEFAKNRRTPGGPTDHVLPVLVVRSANQSQTIRAIYTSYACHCVTLSDTKINGDWAGYAVESIERHFPTAIGMVSIGCGSDQNPESGVTGDKIDVAKMQGMQIGDEIARLVDRDQFNPIQGEVDLRSSELKLAFDPLPTVDEYKQMRDAGGAAGYNAATQLAKLDAGESLPNFLPYPIHVLTFGDDLCMVFLAGEVCVDYALRIRRELNGTKLWMHGYSNDFGAYIPSERLLREGGYGAGAEIPYFALPAKLKTGIEEQIIDEVHRLVPDSFDVPEGTDGIPPQSPHASLRLMETHDDLEIQLVAAEPQVSDPVAIDFGLQGELWVCQMSDYGHGVDEEFEPSGEIRRLIDEDQDGFFESSEVFLGGLRYPTDVKVWRKGLLVCDAPDILYIEDTDGDGKADRREVLYSGFATHNGQARVNSLRWGLDNWLHGSCGLFGGMIRNAQGETFDVTQRDFRIRPETGELEPVTGRSQQGRVRDDFGHWFGCDNGTLIRQYVIDDQYLRRNPFAEPPATSVYVPAGSQAGTLYPASELVLFKLSGNGGRATAACGLGIYRDTALGREYDGNSFTCEPVNQLVYRQILHEQEGIIRGMRAASEESRDFLTSRDRWFRPVQVRTGPDGGLWVVDMYRYVIEHPIWIPDERKQSLNVFAGQGKGRIYRVVSRNAEQTKVPNLNECSNAQLVDQLDQPNGILRDLAHQLLLWRDAHDVAQELQRLVRHGKTAAVRVQALSVLAGLDQLTSDVCMSAMEDSDARVRRAAVRFSEPLVESSKQLTSRLLNRSHDNDLGVRLQVAYTLGTLHDDALAGTWKRLYESSQNEYLRYALLSSLNEHNVARITRELFKDDATRRTLSIGYFHVATELAGETGAKAMLGEVLQSGESFAWRVMRIVAMLDVLDRRKLHHVDVRHDVAERADQLLQDALDIVAAVDSLDEDAQAALQLLGRRWGSVSNQLFGVSIAPSHDRIATLLSSTHPVDLQLAAVSGLMRRGEQEDAESLLEALPSSTPAVRRAIVGALLQQSRWAEVVVTALEQGTLQVGDFDAAQRQQLVSASEETLSHRLHELMSSSEATERKTVIADFQAVYQMRGDVNLGREVFKKTCATCHRLENVGNAVGPDLAGLTSLTSRSLLTAILDPNRDVDGRYRSYVVVTDDGLSFSGVLTEETSTNITIVDQQGKTHALLRQRIEALQATGKSAMPEGLEQDISQTEMANLLAYLQQAGPAPKTFTGNEPRVIEPDEHERIVLSADAAAIYGDQIVFESQSPFKNIGYWHSGTDHAVWNVHVKGAREYDVWLEYACADTTAGNEFQFDGGHEPLTFQVQGTGGWGNYKKVKLGSLHLDPGQTRLIAHGSESFRGGALLDLRAIVLEPK